MSPSSLRSLLVAAGVVVCSSAAATPFSLSYAFAPDSPGAYAPIITGTFEGVRNGDFVESITNLSLAIDGVTLSPVASLQFFIAGYNAAASDWSMPPAVSFTFLSNNFGISDADLGAGDFSGDFFFYVVPGDINVQLFAFSGSLGINEVDALPDVGTWKLTDLSGPVALPDTGSTAATFLLTLAAIGLLRRTRQV